MATSIRIQHLQWIVGAVAAFCCAVLGGLQIAYNLTELSRTGRAMADLTGFGLILAATDMISAERGPAGAAMDPLGDATDEWRGKLAAVRAETDARLARARAVSMRDRGADLTSAFDLVGRRLREARRTVDAVTARPAAQRDGGAIAAAMTDMFAVADEAAMLRAEAGRRLIRIAPEVDLEVLLQAEASAFREEAGRLGSYAVMKLTGGLTAEEARIWSLRKQDLLHHFRLILSVYGRKCAEDEMVSRALEDVEQLYFTGSLPLAQQVFADPTVRVGATDFTIRSMPGLEAPTRLEDSLHLMTLHKIQRSRDAAATATLVSTGLTTAVLLTLLWLGLTLRSRLFGSLSVMHEEIEALAVGELTDPPSRPRSAPEIEEMFAGLAVLREELRRKHILERVHRRTNRDLKVLAETDALTGLLNRRAVAAQVPPMLDAADQEAQPVGAILLDIDHFKMVNDIHGHAAGDAVLQGAARALRTFVGSGDLIARFGGEEFLIVVAGLDEAATYDLADRMRQHLAATPCTRDPEISVTGSFGVACRLPGSGQDWEKLVARADSALYRAKWLGRNRVCSEASTLSLVPEPIARCG